MKALNGTAYEEFGFLTPREHNTFSEIVRVAGYGIACSMALINASIASAFLVQKYRRPVRVNPAGLLVLNLLFADTLLGVAIIGFLSRVATIPHFCGIWTGVLYFASIGSHIALINIVIDRFIAIVHALKYRGYMTMVRSRAMVICGWSLPSAGLVYGIVSNNWDPGPVTRCPQIFGVRMFIRYMWVPSLIVTNLCVIVIQCRVYLYLRRYDTDTASIHGSCSHKFARMLFWITTPTCAALLSYDVVIIFIVPRTNSVLRFIYGILLLSAEFSFLMNPVVYSYATVSIKKPVSDLYSDMILFLRPARTKSDTPAKKGVSVIGTESYVNEIEGS